MVIGKKFKLLIADDEPDLVELLVDILGDIAEIKTAFDGKSAMDFNDKEDFDLIISDFFMPEMTGIDLYHSAIKKNPIQKFIIMTAFVKKVIDDSPLTENELLLKPFSAEDVTEKVLKILGENP